MSDAQFFNNGLYSQASGNSFTPSFTDANGKLIIEAGAQINTHAPASVTQGGGYALLLGGEVRNDGTIITPRGQTQLAAGDSFILRPGYSSDSNQISTTRGNEVAPVRAADSPAGLVVNSGVIQAERGDITLAGHDVQQQGVALATTSVAQRGTIHLLNSASDTTGKVTLGKGSVTSVLIEDSTDTALDSQRDALIADSKTQDDARANSSAMPPVFDNLSRQPDRRDQSRVEIVSGGSVNFENQSLALATGGQIAVSATSRTFVADGARLDVAGAPAVKVAMESNNVKISVQGNEQRDAPGSRDKGSLNSKDVWVDVRDLTLVPAGTGGYATDRYYTPGGLLEVSGYLGTTGHTIGEWAAVGGAVRLSGSEVIAQKGSSINLAGGVVATADGLIRTSYVRGTNGLLYDVNRAPGDLLYSGVYSGFEVDYARWGVTDRFYNVALAPVFRWQKGYVSGRDGGALLVDAPTAVLEGDLFAGVLQGERQSAPRVASVTDGYKSAQSSVARAGRLALGAYLNDTALLIQPQVDVRFTGGDAQAWLTEGMAADGVLPATRMGTAWVDAARLSRFGLGGIEVFSGGSIRVDAPVTLADGGSLRLVAPDIDIAASLTARAGSISIGNLIDSSNVLVRDGRAHVAVASGVTLDVRGKWVNALQDGNTAAARAFADGGSVEVASTHGVALAEGSRIDASSGGAVLTNGALYGGTGGAISLTASHRRGYNATGVIVDPAATLQLGGELLAYGAKRGGTLALSAGAVRIGGGQPAASGELVLPETLFTSGFSAYDINGFRSLDVASDARVDAVQPVYRLTEASRSVPTGTDPAQAMPVFLPQLLLENPVSATLAQRGGADLTLRSSGVFAPDGTMTDGGRVTIATGSRIGVDPGRTIRIDGKDQVLVDGTLTAHGGTIAVVNTGAQTEAYASQLAVTIGDNARLDVSARALTARDQHGRTYGIVPDGGAIILGSEGGVPTGVSNIPISTDAFVIMRPGAVLDASGTWATLATQGVASPLDPLFGATYEATSAGGSITVRSYNGFTLDGTLRAAAGGAGASGGRLALELETRIYGGAADSLPEVMRVPREIVISQSDLAPQPFRVGYGAISANRVRAGGFDNLSLHSRDAIDFRGDVELTLGQHLNLTAGWLTASELITGSASVVRLAAPYVSLGAPPATVKFSNADAYPVIDLPRAPVFMPATASLSVSADLIDLGKIDVSGLSGIMGHGGGRTQAVTRPGFASADFESRGDIRVLGTVRGNVDLTLGAAQIYPVTMGEAALLGAGHITLRRTTDDLPAPPLSVLGALSVFAPEIEQGGILRAPLGRLTVGAGAGQPTLFGEPFVTDKLTFLPGSITSVSGAGVSVPFGGTVDGISYTYGGTDVSAGDLKDLSLRLFGSGITLGGKQTTVMAGATLDLSGGGDLRGAAFVSGRGGSVDVLATALANASPANKFSKAGNAVYAIVPGVQPGVAPVDAAAGEAPAVGSQITLPAGIPGLPAGIYTLMPARYALLPGAFRIELSNTPALGGQAVMALNNGSYAAAGVRSVAHTSQRDAQPTQTILTSGELVRKYAQYAEMSYADFALERAATFGNPSPPLPADGKVLLFNPSVSATAGLAVQFDGNAIFTAAQGGNPGVAAVNPLDGGLIEVLGRNANPTVGYISLRDRDLNALAAPTLMLGTAPSREVVSDTVSLGTSADAVVLRQGAALYGPEVFLAAGPGGITLESGSRIDTLGRGTLTSNHAVNAYTLNTYRGSGGMSVLAVSNNWLNILPPTQAAGMSTGGIRIEDARIYTEGSFALALRGAGALTIDPAMRYGARELSLSVPAINLGESAALAAAARDNVLPAGLEFDQVLLNRLLAGNDEPGVPALESLRLGARESINVFGTVNLDTIDPATGQPRLKTLVLNTPAIYGRGGAGDTATLSASRLVWSGVSDGVAYSDITRASSVSPGAVRPGGAGTGSGTLNLVADEIVLGYDGKSMPDSRLTLDRLVLGFSTVNLQAAGSITSNHRNSLSVYQTQGDYVPGSGYTRTGGSLNLLTPLLTGDAASVTRFAAGDALTVAPPTGQAPAGATNAALGAEIALQADTVMLATRVALPSGKLTVESVHDIMLTEAAQLDMAGRGTVYFDQTRYSPGGDVVLESKSGNIRQAAGSRIDLSAPQAAGGRLQATATSEGAGVVDLAGRIDGGGALDNADAGTIDVRARVLPDFAGLNRRLNDGGVFGTRSFQVKQGDLVIGDELKAHAVSVSVDGGSLTVSGTIDASGHAPGSIRLAARDNLTLGSNARLDAHGDTLAVDSYGAPIDAANRATVELTAANGMLTLAGGASIDVRAADDVPRGTVVLNASRAGGAAGSDMQIDAAAPLRIDGAGSIALYGFRRYNNAPLDPLLATDGRPIQNITQAWLDGVHRDSQAFMQGAAGNAALQARLAGLRTHGAAFHLRPGVEIVSATSDGHLNVLGDLDLSGYRYGPGATSVRGSGEPGALVIRAGGDLSILGSINDGFAPPAQTRDDSGWKLFSGIDPGRGELVLPVAITLRGGASGTATSFTGITEALDFDLPVRAGGLRADAVIPARVTLNGNANLPAGTVLRAAVRDAAGNVVYAAGTVLAQATTLTRNMQLDAGSVMSVNVQVTAFTVPAGTPLSIFTSGPTLAKSVRLAPGTRLPAGVNVQLANAADTGTVASVDLRPVVGGRQGDLWAVAPMLAPGSESWSMRLAGGADTAAADARALRAGSALDGAGNIRLSDPHYSAATSTRYPVFSVVRTGTGDLDMLAGGSIMQATPFGIYTAGTQAGGIGANGADPYNLPRGVIAGGVVLPGAVAGYESLVTGGNYQAWYPERGGNVTVTAQGDLSGDLFGTQGNGTSYSGQVASNLVGNWLWRQGGAGISQASAWWINFGTYASPYRDLNLSAVTAPQVIGFTGIGALGGGNVRIDVGGNAGVITSRGTGTMAHSSGLNIAVGGTGRVSANGQVLQTGGGNLDIRIGGALNPSSVISQGTSQPEMFGSLVNLRGDTRLAAGALGYVAAEGTRSQPDPTDPRWQSPADTTLRTPSIGAGMLLALGDGETSVSTRGDIVLNAATDPGRAQLANPTPYRYQGVDYAGGGYTWFTLWTDRSAVSLFSSGGNVAPTTLSSRSDSGLANAFSTDGRYVYPGSLTVTAATGSIFYGGGPTANRTLILAPSAEGRLELLAGDSIRGQGYAISRSGANPDLLPTPAQPAWVTGNGANAPTNVTGVGGATVGARNWLFTYQADTASVQRHEVPQSPALFYAAEGDIVGLRTGEILRFNTSLSGAPDLAGQTWYVGASPVRVMAGRDIVNAGTPPGAPVLSALQGAQSSGNLFVHSDPRDISVVAAGRDILQSSFSVAGPGLLEVRAGRNLYQGAKGSLESVGAIVDVDPTSRNSGASIVALAGVGQNGPDYTSFATRYFQAGNTANPAIGLDDAANAGKVAHTYERELAAWLAKRHGFSGSPEEALSAFMALGKEEQGIFVREVYFAELRTSGREFNDAASRRFGSYLRGREAIATLFPSQDAQGKAIAYEGDITLFGPSGIRTNFGGNIETLTPGGRTLIGLEGKVPPASSGLLTQGSGDIRMYSQGSVLLGLSRVFTTFGGDIFAWSATGDINAGRGARTTVVFTPPRRLYDDMGNVTLSPTVPSSGAGIATLNPIAEVPPGDIDLIAPLGTIDAGEAGIRVSGNVNLAALQVVNAANIQVQGKATGLPALASVNVGALTSASAAASAVTQAADDLARQQAANGRDRKSSVVSVQVLGFGEEGQ
ncbi:filamentous hemagglutinin family protein [Helicobacter pylori]